MSHLRSYLHEHFPNGPSETLEDHFFTHFGVKVRSEDGLFLFKYDQICAKWTEPVTHECRGHVLAFQDGIWKHVCRAMDKFFNLSEGKCPIFDPAAFASVAEKLQAYIKHDGTLCCLWFWNGEWRVSTTGKINPLQVGDHSFTFSDLFWSILKKRGNPDALAQMNPALTYMFELVSPYNLIVTDYKEENLFLLCVRDNLTGEYLEMDSLPIGLTRGYSVSPFVSGVSSPDTMYRFTEGYFENESGPKNPEGFVLYLNGVPTAKCKTERYLALHNLGGGDAKHARNNIIQLILTGAIDDVYGDLLSEMQGFADRVGAFLRHKTSNIRTKVADLVKRRFSTRKEMALTVQAEYKDVSGLLFSCVKQDSEGFWIDCDEEKISYWVKTDASRLWEKEMKAL